MTPVNLGVCFGPSLLRPEFETVSSIYDIKFRNAIVELIITHYEKMFQAKLQPEDIEEMVGATENDQAANDLSNSLSSLTVRFFHRCRNQMVHLYVILVVKSKNSSSSK